MERDRDENISISFPTKAKCSTCYWSILYGNRLGIRCVKYQIKPYSVLYYGGDCPNYLSEKERGKRKKD